MASAAALDVQVSINNQLKQDLITKDRPRTPPWSSRSSWAQVSYSFWHGGFRRFGCRRGPRLGVIGLPLAGVSAELMVLGLDRGRARDLLYGALRP